MRRTLETPEHAYLDAARSEGLKGQAPARERAVYRLRDLDRRGRWVALVFAVALSLPPVAAFAWAVPDWAPAGDPALMGLRTLDVGTWRTPLIGQPSSSALYVPSEGPAHHLGPTHFYLLAGPVRLFGGGIGMPLVSVLIVATCVLIAAWAVFRQLGPPAAVVAAVILGGIMFTTGASSLIDPVSSRVAGYPLLCSAVLLWCVACADLRLLPLTTAAVSFTAQQHLSVGPATGVLTAGAGASLVVWLARHGRWRDPKLRRHLAWWSSWSTLVALVMWAPVLLDQAVGDGNLSRLASYLTSNDHATLGATSSVRQVIHAVGLPPLLGQPEFSGQWLLARPSMLTWLSAAVVAAVVAAFGVRWWRTSPRKSALAIMTAVAALAGLANGSSVPVGFEQARSAFYHWSFVLAFFTYLVFGLGALDLARRTTFAARASFVPAMTSLALVAIVVPSALNPALDRTTNTLEGTQAFWKSRRFDHLADVVLAHRDQLGTQTVLFGGAFRSLVFPLAERGLDVRLPRSMRGFVHDDRLVDKSTVQSGLFLHPIFPNGPKAPPGGELLAEVLIKPDAETDAFSPFPITAYRLYLLDREELLTFARPNEL